MKTFRSIFILNAMLQVAALTCSAQESADPRGDYIRSHYTKFEYRIPMRDGTKLFTCAYVPNVTGPNETGPNETGPAEGFPILLFRTPYSVGPYGAGAYKTLLGPSEAFEHSGYVSAFQDVRGRYMSEGEFVNMRPHLANKSGNQFDESTDTFDTIEWLVKHVGHNNGRVGQWGISYPGFYTSAGAIDSHPALKCISPQAPIADWFWDDMHRNGAFNAQLAFSFFSSFGRVRPEPTVVRSASFDFGTSDAYQFFLDLGSLKNVNEKLFLREIPFWNEISEHPNYDYFWQTRNILPHLKNVHCASLVVGGWFDTEDLYGPLKTYESIEKNNPQIESSIVMGPWFHGGWNRTDGSELGAARFDWPTAKWYRDEIEFPFFERHLKRTAAPATPEATMFETGANRWRKFDHWPPKQSQERWLYLSADEELSWEPPADAGQDQVDHYPSDPSKPVPYTMEIAEHWSKDYMAEDQRFAARRPDVLVYRSQVLSEDLTIAGPMLADLWFSTTGTDADIVVKVIDEFPGRAVDGAAQADPAFPSGRQQLVRGQVMRARFRKNFVHPQPLVPDQPEQVQFELQDILHTFQRGHRVMIQVQSTWFPFVDRNPQKYVPNIFEASEDDFIVATHSVHRSSSMASRLKIRTLAGQ